MAGGVNVTVAEVGEVDVAETAVTESGIVANTVRVSAMYVNGFAYPARYPEVRLIIPADGVTL